jgi:cation-dependent mannose-6-phosphate receptor
MSLTLKHSVLVASLTAFISIASFVSAETFGDCSRCSFPEHKDERPKSLERLKPLCGHRFEVDDVEINATYRYNFGICTSAQIDPKDRAAVTQIELNKLAQVGPESKIKTLGSLDHTDIIAGTNWIYLQYTGGDEYSTHCNKKERRTVIMINCNENESVGKPRWLEENNNRSSGCYYLFELEHLAACSIAVESSQLSAGSIICIVFGSIVCVYLLIGIAYKRIVMRSKGLQQIPNYEFWKDFGHLQADGCDLICRCGGNKSGQNPYHGIGDRQIESANDDADVDDRILPM